MSEITPIAYNDAALRQQLEGLDPTWRAAFAAACAERLLPTYRSFHQETGQGDPVALAQALNVLWTSLAGAPIGEDELRQHAAAADALIPSDDDWTELTPYAENAVTAVVYALNCRLTGDVAPATWSALQAYEALDEFVVNRDLDLNTPGAEARILGDPLIQAELARQSRDLADLAASSDHSGARVALIERLRDRARVEAPHFLPLSPRRDI